MKFAIITPAYNRAYTLPRAIDSILKQDYKNYEMIIIDDGSTDNTDEVMQRYRKYSHIKYIKCNQNRGVNVARNIGFKNISEDVDWVTFLDSDDDFLFDALSKMKKIIEKNTQYNYFRFAEAFETGVLASYATQDNFVADYRETVKEENVSGGWTATMHKSIIDNGFMFEERVNGYESLSWFKLSKTEKCFYSLALVKNYRVDTISLCRPKEKNYAFYENQKFGNELILEEYEEDMIKFKSRHLAVTLYELGKLYTLLGEKQKGFNYTIRAIKNNPWSLRVFRNFLVLMKKPLRREAI